MGIVFSVAPSGGAGLWVWFLVFGVVLPFGDACLWCVFLIVWVLFVNSIVCLFVCFYACFLFLSVFGWDCWLAFGWLVFLGFDVLFLFGEFDPGSGRTLAACLTHASRTLKPSLLGG